MANGPRPQIHPVNLRWFGGTILTGIAGVALMSAAIFAAMHGETLFAQAPGFAQPHFAALGGGRMSNALHKSDRILPRSTVHESRQTFRISTTTETGGREVVRTHPVTLVSASLLTGDISAYKFPRFNPMSLFDADTVRNADPGPEPDGDISYVLRDLRTIPLPADEGPHLTLGEVMARVGEAAAVAALHRVDPTAMPPPGGMLALASGEHPAPEGATPLASSRTLSNMTVLVKAAATAHPAAASTDGEQTVVARAGDTLQSVLGAGGVAPDQVKKIVATLAAQSVPATLSPGDQVKILLAPHAGADGRRDAQRIVLIRGQDEISVVQSETGGYAVVAGAVSLAETADEIDNGDDETGTMPRLYDSLYATALAKHIPDRIIGEMVHIFGDDADFTRRVTEGDGFQLLYDSDMHGEPAGTRPDILFASLIANGETLRFYRFQLPDGTVDYFDQDGRSMRKFLLRKPVPGARFSRGFGMERHPILGVVRMHTGVDWAAPRGTPILAAGNGVIEAAKWVSGYGRQVRIRHSNGYETTYGHMSAFARGIDPGVHVRQGQVIGYVGSTGLSTGPHCHFEVIVNGRFVDPMRIRVPREHELKGEALAAFEQERMRIDDLTAQGASASEAIAGSSQHDHG